MWKATDGLAQSRTISSLPTLPPSESSATRKLAHYSCLLAQLVTRRGWSEILHFIMTAGIVNDWQEGNHSRIFNSRMNSRL